jgi:nicotinic acid phosphoribosyltransferase
MFTINPLLKTDSYKLSHKDMYPEGLENVYSNFTSRGSRIPGVNHTVNFGLQYFLTDLQSDFEALFAADKDDVVADYKKNTSTFVSPGFSVEELEDLHDLGYLPLRFSQLPEGTLVPIKVPAITIESTHKDFAWLVNYFETNLSATIWHPSTSATTAWDMRRTLDYAAAMTGGAEEAVDFQLHDFSYRGMENWQAAAASSAGHLLSFLGSDVVPVVPWVNHYYPGEDNGLIAASVPATEHSVMCAGGKDGEKETIRRLLKTYPDGILSIVMDTWDLFYVLTVILPELKDEIMSRNGKLVVRPDSGDPADIVCGTMEYSEDLELAYRTASYKGAIEILWETFGGTVNEIGFKELDSHIGLIYGDSITKDRLKDINGRLARKGFASTNWVAGVGSYTYQMVTRDTFGSAVKATQVTIKGEVRNIFKDPATDNGLKKSATGRLSVQYKANGELYLTDRATPEQEAASLIQPVWENGKFLKTQSFANVRAELRRHTEILTRAGKLGNPA